MKLLGQDTVLRNSNSPEWMQFSHRVGCENTAFALSAFRCLSPLSCGRISSVLHHSQGLSMSAVQSFSQYLSSVSHIFCFPALTSFTVVCETMGLMQSIACNSTETMDRKALSTQPSAPAAPHDFLKGSVLGKILNFV